MIRKLILKRLDSEEQSLGESLDYLRYILRASIAAFVKFALFTPLAQHRNKLPVAPYRVARIVATRDEDCGTCVQIEVNLARREGVPASTIRAVLDDRPQELPPELADVYGFAKAVVEARGEESEFRQLIRERYGDEGLVELALGIAAARVFPVTKRALGLRDQLRVSRSASLISRGAHLSARHEEDWSNKSAISPIFGQQSLEENSQ